MTIHYFLYGKGPCCAKSLTGIDDISLIRFDFKYRNGGYGGRLVTSSELYHNYKNDQVAVVGVNGNIVQIEIW